MKPELMRFYLTVWPLVVVLVVTFAIMMPKMATWGATPAENRRAQ